MLRILDSESGALLGARASSGIHHVPWQYIRSNERPARERSANVAQSWDVGRTDISKVYDWMAADLHDYSGNSISQYVLRAFCC